MIVDRWLDSKEQKITVVRPSTFPERTTIQLRIPGTSPVDFREGDKVHLTGDDSVTLTVHQFIERQGLVYAECLWFDNNHKLQKSLFNMASLAHYGTY